MVEDQYFEKAISFRRFPGVVQSFFRVAAIVIHLLKASLQKQKVLHSLIFRRKPPKWAIHFDTQNRA